MESIFTASEPNLGYLFQVRCGLLRIVSEQNTEAKLFIEKIDDISIETPVGLDVYQTKLHINSVANLTNASTDLWKTIRVWSEEIINGHLDLDNCLFFLITTATASFDTIPFKLKQGTSETRDVDELLESLLGVATTSKSETNKAAYAAFVALSNEQQKKLIKRISVIDASVNLNEAKDGIIQILQFSTQPARVNALYERLEGWFLNEVILQLQNMRAEITKKEVVDKVLDISDTLKSDNLPADFTVSIATEESQLSPYRNQTFVKQLQVVDINSQSLNHAISDYHRAFSQKSKWLRDGLINPNDEIEYDGKLVDDWEGKFALLEECANKDETTKKAQGKNFYQSHYVSSTPNIHIKDRFNQRYMVAGSCQMLSDKKKIGWHPDFKTII